jgi:hypothetical protein
VTLSTLLAGFACGILAGAAFALTTAVVVALFRRI